MRTVAFVLALLSIACGGSGGTEPGPVRYNFAVVDGRNQAAPAGAGQLANRITSQLTRDPQGTFASRALDRVGDFLLPALAYAQGLTLAGEPVQGAIVCGREALPNEPQVQPLCAFTLADGKAANTVVPGTKAGTYNVVFTAQNVGTEPVKDSTTVIVQAAAPSEVVLLDAPNGRTLAVGASLDLRPLVVFVRDQYANDVAWSQMTPGVALRDGTEVGQPTQDSTSWTIAWDPKWSGRRAYVYVWFGTARASFPLDFK